jgi:hypothetical protein
MPDQGIPDSPTQLEREFAWKEDPAVWVRPVWHARQAINIPPGEKRCNSMLTCGYKCLPLKIPPLIFLLAVKIILLLRYLIAYYSIYLQKQRAFFYYFKTGRSLASLTAGAMHFLSNLDLKQV